MDKYVVVKQIGRGSFGRCILVQRKADKKSFVLKEVNVQEMTGNERKEAMNEVNVLSVLRHPNIIAYQESFVADGLLHIIMEYAEGGDLHQVIQKKQGEKNEKGEKGKSYFTELEIMTWFCQIALALQYTHKKNILHRDLKTQNIFLTSTKVVKLGDFGIAKVLNSDTEFAKTIIGTPYYLSPEMCEDQPYDHKSDIWALGCVLYELSTLRHAFDANSLPALVLKILKGNYPPIPQMYSNDLASLVKSMLRTEPKERPSITEVLETSIVQKYLPNNVAPAPRRLITGSKKPTTGDAPKKPNSPEKLQFLKLKHEPKILKPKEKKGGSKPSSPAISRVKPPVPRKSPTSGTSSPASGTPRQVAASPLAQGPAQPAQSPRGAQGAAKVTPPRGAAQEQARAQVTSPRTSLDGAQGAARAQARAQVISPRGSAQGLARAQRARTPPPVGSPRLVRARSEEARPTSSPANSEKTNHTPTPRPGLALLRGPDPIWIQKHQQAMEQRAKNEPATRAGAAVSLGSRKTPNPTVPSQTPKTTSFIGGKKRGSNLDLKQHEQKFKDNLKSVKSRITRDNKPFQNKSQDDEAILPDEASQLETPLSPPKSGSPGLLIVVPPPPRHAASAPTTPRQPTSPTGAVLLGLTSPSSTGTIEGIPDPSAQSPASRSQSAGSPAQTGAGPPAQSPASRAQSAGAKPWHKHARAASDAPLRAAASPAKAAQKGLARQKSFTEKPQSLKDVIKKQRRQVQKMRKSEGGDDLAVEIVLPKYMEHLRIEKDEPSLPDKESDRSPDPEVPTSAEREGEEGEEAEKGEREREGEEGKEEGKESVDKEEGESGTPEITVNGGEGSSGENHESKKPMPARLSADLSDKMDRLSLRIETLRQKCEQVFGEDTFFKVYKYRRDMKEGDDKEIQAMVGPEKLAYLRYVDQLIFCELQFYGS